MFEGQDETYHNLHFVNDELLNDLQHINFGKAVPHSWK